MPSPILVEIGVTVVVIAASIAFGFLLFRLSRRPRIPFILRNDLAASLSVVFEVLLISAGIAYLVDTLITVF